MSHFYSVDVTRTICRTFQFELPDDFDISNHEHQKRLEWTALEENSGFLSDWDTIEMEAEADKKPTDESRIKRREIIEIDELSELEEVTE